MRYQRRGSEEEEKLGKGAECLEKGKWSAATSNTGTDKHPGFSDTGTFDEQ